MGKTYDQISDLYYQIKLRKIEFTDFMTLQIDLNNIRDLKFIKELMYFEGETPKYTSIKLK